MKKKFRRDRLMRLVSAGRVALRQSYQYSDGYGESVSTRRVPVAVMPDDPRTVPFDGTVCYIYASAFVGKAGSCWQNADGSITLYVHSNQYYDLEILPEAA